MTEQKIAFKGNWSALRLVFFQLRGLISLKKVEWRGKISEVDTEFIKTRLVPNAGWSTSEATVAFNLVKKFQPELNYNGVMLDSFENYSQKQGKNQLPGPVTTKEVSKPRSIGYESGKFTVSFSKFDPNFQNLLNGARKLPNRTFDSKKECWIVPSSHAEEIKEFAEIYKFVVGDQASKYIFGSEEAINNSYSAERVELNLPLKMRLFDYQTVGVSTAIKNPGTLLADAPGLGKTCQAIGYAVGVNQWPVLVFVPKNLLYNWKNEIEAWTNKKVKVIDSDKKKQSDKIMERLNSLVEADLCHFLIVNFHGCVRFMEEMKKHGKGTMAVLNKRSLIFKNVIIDEAHQISNPKTTNFKVIRQICRSKEQKVVLTGTPIVNKIDDMASMLDLCGRLDTEFGGRFKFVEEYGDVTRGGFEGKSKKTPNLQRLNEKLRISCMVRREKYQVLTELPDKIRQMHDVELSNRKEYDHCMLNLQDWMASNGSTDAQINKSMQAEFMVKIAHLKKLSAIGKIHAVVEAIKELHSIGEKAVVFAWHKDTLKLLKIHFPHMQIINGDVKSEDATAYVKEFQTNSECNIIGGSYKSMGVGHTMTAASNWFCLEHPWTDAILIQAEDRLHRHGQKNTVYCHHFLGKDTIDHYIYSDIILKKRHLSKAATGGTEEILEESASKELWNMLINKTEIVED